MYEKLIDRMIAVYGYENPIVVQFAELCEQGFSEAILLTVVESHEQFPVKEF